MCWMAYEYMVVHICPLILWTYNTGFLGNLRSFPSLPCAATSTLQHKNVHSELQTTQLLYSYAMKYTTFEYEMIFTFSVPYRIHKYCYHQLAPVWSLNVISCIIIRDEVSVSLYSFRIWQNQNSVFLIKHALCWDYNIFIIFLQCKIVGWKSWLTVHLEGSWIPS